MSLERDTFRRLCVARDLLREARDEPLSVHEIAERVTLSRFHFIRQFESVFADTRGNLIQIFQVQGPS